MGEIGQYFGYGIVQALWKNLPYGLGFFLFQTRDEDVLALSLQLFHDGENLSGSLSFPPDHLWKTFSKAAMLINPGKPQVFKRKRLQFRHGLIQRRLPRLHFLQKILQLANIHLSLLKIILFSLLTKSQERFLDCSSVKR